MKYKIEFSGQAEVLFAMMAKLLPDELNIHVEEIEDMPIGKTQSVIEKLMLDSKLSEPDKKERFKHTTGKPLTDFIISYMKKSPNGIASWGELNEHSMKVGFKKSTINNAISRLINWNKIERISTGKYKLVRNIQDKDVV